MTCDKPILAICFILTGVCVHGQTQKVLPGKCWIDSLQRIVRRGLYRRTDARNCDAAQVRYIRACTDLGRYFVKRRKWNTAMSYYGRVIGLTDGTDSNLGANEKAIRVRNSACFEVARLYEKGLLPLSGLKSVYVGHYINPLSMPATFTTSRPAILWLI